jgi:prepilin-type N-terminal cleavage/methylation domain-containing protein
MSRRGFTLFELLLSAAILAILLLSGIVASRSATNVAQDAIRIGSTEARALRVQEQLRQLLGAASRATLETLPEDGSPPAPMADGEGFDHVRFRRAIAAGPAGPVLEPALADPPFELRFRQDAGGDGRIVWTDDRGERVLCAGLQAAEFERTGSELTLRITATARGPRPETRTVVRSLVLRNP